MREDWIEVELGELSLLELGGDWGKDPNIEDEEYLEAYCIRGSEFRKWENDKGKTASLRKIKKDSIEKRNLLLDDILVEISGGGPEQPVGRTVVIEHSVLNHFKGKNLVCTNFLRLIRPSDFVNSIYLNYYLKYFYSIGKIIPYQSGSNNLRNLKFNDYLTVEIPLSPLPIQRAIVSKIEALFSDLDNGIANFKKAQEQLKIYRQAVLKKAFEGELTAAWREKQTNLPTAEELLKQIKEERQNHYNQQMEDWKKAVKEWEKKGSVGKKPSKPTQPKELPPLKKDELEELAILPFGWTWCRIAEIGSVETGATPKRGNLNYWENGSIPWITSGALNDDFVRECKEYVTEQALKETNIKVFPKHSLVMAMYGEGKTRGKSSELLIDTSTNQAIACIIQKNTESKTKNYLKSFLVKIYQDIRRKSSGGVQPNINLDIVKNLNLPLCSLEEQNQIVQEIESRLSVCDKMEQSINESIEKAEALRQSILKKAFEGKLLSQAEIELCKKEADYEPASELLKKIQAEKLAKELEKKKPITKKKSKK
jgi:type I restriction enzyme S subunit